MKMRASSSSALNVVDTSCCMVVSIVWFCFLLAATHTAPCVVAKGGQRDSFSTLLKRWKRSYPDWSPRAILDIGANAGAWSTGIRNQYPDSKILMLEASDALIPALEETVYNIGNAKYRIAALTANDGDVILQDHTQMFSHIKPARKISIRLDTLVKEESTTGESLEAFPFLKESEDVFDLIKLDVQGAELLVLKGGLDTLQKASVIQFVGSTVEYDAADSCVHEMDAFLRAKGFFLYDHSDDGANEATKLMTFKTLGLGQWGMIYVNMDSNHVPHQLQSRAPNFCGSSPEKRRQHQLAYHTRVSTLRPRSKYYNNDDKIRGDYSFWKIALPALCLGACFGILLSCVCMKCCRPKKARRKL